MRGFGLDGKFFRGLTKAGDFLILGLITVIFCIPVITIGASLTAAFYAGMKLVKDEENYVFKDFWKSFKTNFVQGLLVELIMGVIGLLLFFDIRALCLLGILIWFNGWYYFYVRYRRLCSCMGWCSLIFICSSFKI